MAIFCHTGPLLAIALGVAGPGGVEAQAPHAPNVPEIRDAIVVTADRLSDAATTSKLTSALQRDPYIFSDHVTVSTENGIVKITGRISDLADLFRILKLARQVAGRVR